MTDYKRFAVYYAPEPGALADLGARWLGWDAASGTPRDHPDLPDLPRPASEITATPRKYGFHGTMKPPFRLAAETTREALLDDLTELAASTPPVRLTGLKVARLGRFLALVPEEPSPALDALAAACVTRLDAHRAPLTEDEIARRKRARLTDRQEQLLEAWGYPYVMEEFRFHMTLTGPLADSDLDAVQPVLAEAFGSVTDRPYDIASLCLFGEAEDGRFHIVARTQLTR